MKLLILKNCKGSEDGLNVKTYKSGDVIEVTERLSNVFIENGWAIIDNDEPAPVLPVVKEPKEEKVKKRRARKKKK